jgi:TolB protein
MRNRLFASLLYVTVAGCAVGTDPVTGGDDTVDPADPVMSELKVSPSGFVARVIDDAVVDHQFTAVFTAADGTVTDVTDDVEWSLADTRFGKFHGNRLTVMGGGAGQTEVIAKLRGGQTVATPITVFVSGTRNLGAPDYAASLFDSASPAANCAPTIAYPENHTLVPANLGTLDVHWTDAVNDLFKVHVHNLYVDLTFYTRDGWMAVESDWSKFATSRAPITVEVVGMQSTTPNAKCTAAARYVDVTRDDARGAVYYWSTDWAQRAAGLTGQDIMRYDLAKPAIAPAPMFTDANRPATCVGCHALSRDGGRIAMTMDGSTGRGAVIDLASNRQLMPTGNDAPRWSTAVFNHDGNKLIAVQDGQMRLITATTGETLASVPNTAGTIAGNPEFSPDGTKLVNVESTGTDDWAFGNASIVVRDFDNRANEFGAAQIVVPFDIEGGTQSYYPSWSPDGKWLAVTRSPNGNSYANPDATIWVVKADGSVPAIEMTATNGVMDSWARWMPAANTVDGETVYFLTFSSARPFGSRIPEGGLPQIWVTPFYPNRAVDGRPATGAAYRAPFQSIYSSNHNAQWTTAVVAAQ